MRPVVIVIARACLWTKQSSDSYCGETTSLVCVNSTYCFCYVHIFLYGLLFKQETEDNETVSCLIIPRLSFFCVQCHWRDQKQRIMHVLSQQLLSWVVSIERQNKKNRQAFPFLAAERLTPLVSNPTVLKGTDLIPSTSDPTSYLGSRRMHFNIILSSPSCSSKICSIQCCIVSLSKLHAHRVVIRLLS